MINHDRCKYCNFGIREYELKLKIKIGDSTENICRECAEESEDLRLDMMMAMVVDMNEVLAYDRRGVYDTEDDLCGNFRSTAMYEFMKQIIQQNIQLAVMRSIAKQFDSV